MTDISVVHAGADHTAEGFRAKLARDFRLLRMEHREQPHNPFTLFNLGMTFSDVGKHRYAVKWLRQSLAASHPGDSPVRKVYSLLVVSLHALGRLDEAWDTCQEGLSYYPKDPELVPRRRVGSRPGTAVRRRARVPGGLGQ